ncbi:MAG: metalloregulator ArsR/SmtB family transcription factor [Polyangiaceae bacterium]
MADPLSTTLFALADPTRRGILARLARGDATVNELAEPFEMTLAAVSKHIKVLESAGLVSRRREAQSRPCKLDGAPLRAISAWLDDYRRFWDRSFDALDEYLVELQSEPSAPKPAKNRAPKRPKSERTPRRRRGR